MMPDFVRGHVAALEAGGDALVERGFGQQIAGQLFDGELVERQIAVEGRDHPVAIRPDLAVIVDVDAVRVAVARGVQPVAGAVFAVMRRGQVAIHHALVSIRGDVSCRKASISAGLGGRPVVSRATRRISARRFSAAERAPGPSPRASPG